MELQPREVIGDIPEPYSAPSTEPTVATAEALDAILPERRDLFVKATIRTDAAVALFGGRVSTSTIINWRCRRRAPAWALTILIEKLEQRANRCLELANRLKALLP